MKYLIAVVLLLFSFLLACQKDNVDTTNFIDPTVEPEVKDLPLNGAVFTFVESGEINQYLGMPIDSGSISINSMVELLEEEPDTMACNCCTAHWKIHALLKDNNKELGIQIRFISPLQPLTNKFKVQSLLYNNSEMDTLGANIWVELLEVNDSLMVGKVAGNFFNEESEQVEVEGYFKMLVEYQTPFLLLDEISLPIRDNDIRLQLCNLNTNTNLSVSNTDTIFASKDVFLVDTIQRECTLSFLFLDSLYVGDVQFMYRTNLQEIVPGIYPIEAVELELYEGGDTSNNITVNMKPTSLCLELKEREGDFYTGNISGYVRDVNLEQYMMSFAFKKLEIW